MVRTGCAFANQQLKFLPDSNIKNFINLEVKRKKSNLYGSITQLSIKEKYGQ